VLCQVATAGYAALSRPTALWCFAIIPDYAFYNVSHGTISRLVA